MFLIESMFASSTICYLSYHFFLKLWDHTVYLCFYHAIYSSESSLKGQNFVG